MTACTLPRLTEASGRHECIARTMAGTTLRSGRLLPSALAPPRMAADYGDDPRDEQARLDAFQGEARQQHDNAALNQPLMPRSAGADVCLCGNPKMKFHEM